MSTIAYKSHGGIHQVAIVHCPQVFGQRLAHLSQDGPSSWVLRDFISGQMLRCAPPPGPSDTALKLTDIEKLIAYSEAPPFHNVENEADWSIYLRLRTLAVLGEVGVTAPSASVGTWRPL